MTTEIKATLFFAVLFAVVLLLLYMIIIRTIATMEFALDRVEELLKKEVFLSKKYLEQTGRSQEKSEGLAKDRAKRNELLLNIPFMERLSKEKKKEGSK